jgi:hypothetical protein
MNLPNEENTQRMRNDMQKKMMTFAAAGGEADRRDVAAAQD